MIRSRGVLVAALWLAVGVLAPSAAHANVDLLSQANIRLDGAAANDQAGTSVAGAGDVNNDGRADVIVGAPSADNNLRGASGSAYVVFGKTTITGVDLNALGSAGFRIDGAAASDNAGTSVAGDVNADGRADVIVGATFADNNARAASGSAYVVFGQTTPASVDLNALGSAGFRIDGAAATDQAGSSVAGAGDVNGDGRPDVIVGAAGADNNARSNSGSAYVLFGAGQSLAAAVATSTAWSLAAEPDGSGLATSFSYGARPNVPLLGDWDANGSRTAGEYKGGMFLLNNHNDASGPDITFSFGDPRGFPVAGDFNGDHTDDVAVYRNGTWQVRLSTGATSTFSYGTGTWPATIPLAGDWNRDGSDGIGVYTYSSATWELRNSATAGPADAGTFIYGAAGSSYPVVGDWNGDAIDTAGVRTGLSWTLRNTNAAGSPDITPYDFGAPNALPLSWRTAPTP